VKSVNLEIIQQNNGKESRVEQREDFMMSLYVMRGLLQLKTQTKKLMDIFVPIPETLHTKESRSY
jgi:hypothetical protein